MVFLRIHGERFEVSETALERCGSDSMLVQATAHEGEKLNWPFSVAAFSKVLEWANTGELPQAGSLPQAKMAEVCRYYILSTDPTLTRHTYPPSPHLRITRGRDSQFAGPRLTSCRALAHPLIFRALIGPHDDRAHALIVLLRRSAGP
jgi:hypothetical protein